MDLGRHLHQPLAGVGVEGHHLAAHGLRVAVGGVEDRQLRMMRQAGPVDLVLRQPVLELLGGLIAQPAGGVAVPINGRGRRVLARLGVPAGDEERLAIRRPRQAEPGGLQRRLLRDLHVLRVDHHQPVRVVPRVQRHDLLIAGRRGQVQHIVRRDDVLAGRRDAPAIG